MKSLGDFLKKMIFDALKSIILVLALIAAVYGGMSFLGYEINDQYFSYSKHKCEEKLKECAQNFISNKEKATQNCDFKCVDPQLIIKKK